MPFGAAVLDGGGVRFRLWAPDQAMVELALFAPAAPARSAMLPAAGGWHERVVPSAGPGTRYAFVIGSMQVPDPASRFNPDGVHGRSVVVDPLAYAWRDDAWRGRPWHEAVIYELHVGTFTPEGTYAAASARLPELAALGVTALELMPVAAFSGQRGWGYDGVLPFAPHAPYGTPEDLKHLVDAAHAHGLMVLLDAVYNHLGPDGNYLHAYCPSFFDAARPTPWGTAIAFDGPHGGTVRDFFVHNALYWIEEYHLDGLRLDAVHAMADRCEPQLVREIARALRDEPGRRRRIHLVLEHDANLARFLERDARAAPRYADAQWNDDLHHAAHALLTGERDGYYADYADAPLAHLGRALAEGFSYQGAPSAWREGRPRGEPSAHLPGAAFVSFLQNHDQIGNRAFGERLHVLCDAPMLEAAYACLLLAPHVPLLFMGEEFAASTPFLYFCDFGPELARAVARGRLAEFGRFAAFADAATLERIADPNDEATFARCVLPWDQRATPPHRERLALIRELLALRRRWLVPRLAGQRAGGQGRIEGTLLRVAWTLGDGAAWRLAVNFGRVALTLPDPMGTIVYAHGAEHGRLAPAGVRVELVESIRSC
jgi:maltooligosyltrehalose trehalohydrolase